MSRNKASIIYTIKINSSTLTLQLFPWLISQHFQRQVPHVSISLLMLAAPCHATCFCGPQSHTSNARCPVSRAHLVDYKTPILTSAVPLFLCPVIAIYDRALHITPAVFCLAAYSCVSRLLWSNLRYSRVVTFSRVSRPLASNAHYRFFWYNKLHVELPAVKLSHSVFWHRASIF